MADNKKIAKWEAVSKIVEVLKGKADSTATYTKGDVDKKFSDLPAIYTPKGSKNTLDEVLALTDAKVGHVYDVKAKFNLNGKPYSAGTNVVCIKDTTPGAHGEDCWDALGGSVDTSNLAEKNHNHEIANVNGLQDALNGKAEKAHSHAITEVTGLEDTLNGKATKAHAHKAAEVTLDKFTMSDKENNDLFPTDGETVDVVIGKVYKAIQDNEAVIAAGFNKLNESLGLQNVDFALPDLSKTNYIATGRNVLDLIIMLDAQLKNAAEKNHEHEIEMHTHADLLSMCKAGKLIAGKKYGINNYVCSYIHPATGSDASFEALNQAPDVKYLILTAVDIDKFASDVEYVRSGDKAEIVECKYEIDPEKVSFTKGMTTHTPTGAVYYMKDEFGNECNYDFKHVTFRRYAIKDIQPNMKPNNGTGNVAGPFRVNVDPNNQYEASDGRLFVGAGEATEKTLIPAIYNGTWRTNMPNTPIGIPKLTGFSNNYINKVLFPFKNQAYPKDKYLAWQTDMYSRTGISKGFISPKNKDVVIQGMTEVTVDNNDYMMRYTFDYEGQDLSEMYRANGRPCVAHVSILAKNQSMKGSFDYFLPNTIIACSKNVDILSKLTIVDVKMSGLVRHNTFFIRSYADNVSCRFVATELGGRNQVSGNLVISSIFEMSKLAHLESNYLCASLSHITGNKMICDVWFGTYSQLQFRESTGNLLWGSEQYIYTTDNDTPHQCKDGEFWYGTQWLDWFGSNIIGPCQYAKFSPHFNSNTLREIYNKGFIFESANQLNSYGPLRWGTRIGYSNGQGIKYGAVVRTTIGPAAFRNQQDESKAVKVFPDSKPAVPDLWAVEVHSNYWKADTIASDLSTAAKNMIGTNNAGTNGGNRFELCPDEAGKWHLYRFRGVEVK